MKTGTFDDKRRAWKLTPLATFFTFLGSLRFLFLVLLLGVTPAICAQSRAQPSPNDENLSGGALFVPSRDVNSSTHFSTVDAARRNRPPEPSKSREDLFYPDGFLTLSSPTPEPVGGNASNVGGASPKNSNLEDKSAQLRPLDPSVETTPVTVGQPREMEKATKPQKRKDRFFFLATSIALAGLAFFVYNELRYREQLREDLVRNARLCSPSATSADFETVLAADIDLTDPRAPSYINPRFDADVLMFDDPDSLGKTLKDPDFTGFRFETPDAKLSHNGPGLGEENFDFMPEGNTSVLDEEPAEDFVVRGDLVAYNDKKNVVEASKR